MNKLKKIFKITGVVLAVFLLFFLVIGAQPYKYPKKQKLEKKLNFLSNRIQNTNLNQISNLNAEWDLFTLSYTVFAATNLVYLDSSFKEKSSKIIDAAIQKALSPQLYSFWINHHNFPQKIDSSGSVLYYGQLNLMLGCYRLLNKDNKYNQLNDKLSSLLNWRFNNISFMCLESYPGMIWIPDNTVALASLKVHSQNTGSNYHETCEKWIKYAKTNFIDKKTKLLNSTLDYKTGTPIEEPRGSMIGWSIFSIYRFDEKFAEELYESYKSKFSTNFLIVRLYKERYKDCSTNDGDFDSGPLILGYSIPANAFAFAGSVAFQDKINAKRLRRVIAFGSKEVETKTEIYYKTRVINFEISPLAEALILFSETITAWK